MIKANENFPHIESLLGARIPDATISGLTAFILELHLKIFLRSGPQSSIWQLVTRDGDVLYAAEKLFGIRSVLVAMALGKALNG